MKSVGNTKLYRALKKKITSISNKELLRQLNIVLSHKPMMYDDIGWHREDVSSAFVWAQTPQGHEYWSVLSKEAGLNWK